jgi:hypothetical protein
MTPSIHEYLSKLEFGEPQQHENIVIFPVYTSQGQTPDYLTLSEALQQHLAVITEVNPGGNVPNIKVQNAAEQFLLLVNGEELIGARQNRTLNTSILLAGKSETIVPVSCTEAGRWAYKTAAFTDAGFVSPHKLRKIKSDSVTNSLLHKMGHKSDQQAVWRHVQYLCSASEACSPTSAMADAIAAKAKEVEGFLNCLKSAPDQKGLIVLINGQVAGCDIVSSGRAYQVLHPKLIKSYVLDALLEPKSTDRLDYRAQVTAFFGACEACQETTHSGVGLGEEHRFKGIGVAGATLVADGQIFHVNFYRN